MTTQKTAPKTRNIATVIFILVCAASYLVLNQAPQTLLIFAGAFNGLILPFGFTIVLWVAWRRKDLLDGYNFPKWLLALGVAAWLLTIFLGVRSISGITALWA